MRGVDQIWSKKGNVITLTIYLPSSKWNSLNKIKPYTKFEQMQLNVLIQIVVFSRVLPFSFNFFFSFNSNLSSKLNN